MLYVICCCPSNEQEAQHTNKICPFVVAVLLVLFKRDRLKMLFKSPSQNAVDGLLTTWMYEKICAAHPEAKTPKQSVAL